MAGIYIHIPFCKSKCSYCDFYSVANQKTFDIFLIALEKEIILRKNEITNQEIETIYFGGGTPSLLDINVINNILKIIYENYVVTNEVEITLEANPDDLSISYLTDLKSNSQINRLSIGIQSFNEDDLKLMKRRHTANQAIESVKNAQNLGFKNISVDLIYGLPKQTIEKWTNNLNIALQLEIQHISAYNLTYEKGTMFYKLLQNNTIQEIDENVSLEMFKILMQKTKEQGFEHYEISNFSLSEKNSKHNSSYWKQKQYLGFGPSAHSYNLQNRSWNFANINKYCEMLSQNKLPSNNETLSFETKYNEYIMTSLRTKWGVDLDYVKTKFTEAYETSFLKISQKYVNQNLMKIKNNNYILTDDGVFVSDYIISDFFMV